MTLYKKKWNDKIEKIIENIQEDIKKLNNKVTNIYKKINSLMQDKNKYKEEDFNKIYSDLRLCGSIYNKDKWFLEDIYDMYNSDELEYSKLFCNVECNNVKFTISAIDYKDKKSETESILYFKTQEQLDYEYNMCIEDIENKLKMNSINNEKAEELKYKMFLIYGIYIKHAPCNKKKILQQNVNAKN